MEKIRPYLKFPSKAPYAWLVYFLVGNILGRLSNLVVYYRLSNATYSIESIVGFLLFLAGAIIGIMAIIQVLVNLIRIIKKEERLTMKKVVIIVLILLFIFMVFNPLANSLLHLLTNNTY